MASNRSRKDELRLSCVTITFLEQSMMKPPPMGTTGSREIAARNVKYPGFRYPDGTKPNRRKHQKSSKPFSATLGASEIGRHRLPMNACRTLPSKSQELKLRAAPFQRKKKHSKVLEYDGSKVISESAAARNTALAAEYIDMLAGKNYLRRQYREQYWVKDAVYGARPRTAAPSTERPRYTTLYPDLGSVLSSRSRHSSESTPKPDSSDHRTEKWRLPSARVRHGSRGSTITFDPPASDSGDKKVVVPELGLAYQAKKSWSNVPSGKSFRVASFPNDALASLCLEGRSAPSRANSSRTSSLSSSTISISGIMDERYNSAGESSPSGSSDAIHSSRGGSGDDEPQRGFPFSVDKAALRQADCSDNNNNESAGVGIVIDSVFDEQGDDVIEDETADDEQLDEPGPTDDLEKGVGRISFSDLEESDISENEADDYEDDAVDETEANRRLKQVSAVFDTTRDTDFRENVNNHSATAGEYSDGDQYESDEGNCNASKYYEAAHYAELLPEPYSSYDLKPFANLPPGVDWRDFVHRRTPNTAKSARQNGKAKDYPDRGIRKRASNSCRETLKPQNIDALMDRLIALKTLQNIAVQFERDRKRHIIHRAKARHYAKSASHSQTSASNSATISIPVTKDQDARPHSARTARRRPSTSGPTTLSKTRKPSSTVDSRNELCNKSAPDLDLVRLSCTRNHLQYLRKNSASPRKRQGAGLFLPRHYEYSWSERLPPNKRPSLNSLSYSKPRNCQYCRDNERKSNLQAIQALMNRPRSGTIPVPNNRHRAQRARPISSSGIIDVTQHRLHVPDPKESWRHCNSTRSSAFQSADRGRGSVTPTAQAKISVARSALASVARDYARAGGKTRKFARRGSATSFRSWRSSPVSERK